MALCFLAPLLNFKNESNNLKRSARILIIRMDKVPHIDQSGMYALEESITDLQKDQVVVVFTCIQPQPYDMLKKIGIIPILVPEMHVFSTFRRL